MNDELKKADEIVRALRWLAKDTEFVFAAENLNDAADLIESLQAEVTKWKERHNQAALNFQQENRENAKLQAQLSESQRREKAAVEDKGTLIKHLRLSGWCNGCKNFAGLSGCKSGQLEKCTGKNDLYEWRGPQAEKGEADGK